MNNAQTARIALAVGGGAPLGSIDDQSHLTLHFIPDMLTDWQDAKEQVRQAVDIVDLVGSYLALRRQGRNFVGLCPWHDDSRPSLQVNPERQSFKCWVCNVGGDVFSFLMQVEGIDFRAAMEMLAERAGIDLHVLQRSGPTQSQFDRRNLLAVMAWAEDRFHECLLQDPHAEAAREYLAARGVSEASIRQFRLGFSPDSWDWLLRSAANASISPEVLERVGLVLRRESGGYYDRFRGRVLFSIRDVRSRPIAFGGRLLPSAADASPESRGAKYINSPETPLFSKSEHLYALDLARDALVKGRGLVVMEGYTDVIMAHQHGIKNAVAVLGTALGERHVPLIKRFTDCVTLVLDGDEAGQRRTQQILDELLALFVNKEIDLRVLSLPSGADPCDVIVSHGSDAFRERLNNSLDALDYKINAVTNGLESAPGTHRTALAVEELIGTLARALPSRAQSTSSALIREQQVLARVSHRFGVDEESLRMRLAAARTELSGRSIRHTSPSSALSGREATNLAAWERELLELLLRDPSALACIADHLVPEEIPHDHCRKLYTIALQLMHAGQIPTFDQWMLSTDEAELKNLLVDCDESGRDKVSSDSQRRIDDLLKLLADNQRTRRHQEAISQFNQQRLDPGQADQALEAIFRDLKRKEESKRRQAGSLPTDG